MSRQKTNKSRRATPWDGKADVTPTQAYIRERHKEHYHNHHKPLKDDDETKLINKRIPSECRLCKSTDFKRYGFNENGIQIYKCRSCGHKFTVLTNTIFDSHKIPISEWIEFLYNLFSFVSLNAGSWNNKNAFTTSKYWLEKVFILVKAYQNSVILKDRVVLDETFYPLQSSELVVVEGKKLRGLSRNQICIGVACDSEHVFCVLEGNGKPSQKKTFEAFKDHIVKNSTLVHDKEQAHKKLVDALDLTSETYAADQIKKLKDADNPLQRVNRIHFFLKRFLSAHTGFKREEIEGFINLFSFVMNPPEDKLEKVGILLDLGLECAQILRFRDVFGRKNEPFEGF
jgi:transposase-like protein